MKLVFFKKSGKSLAPPIRQNLPKKLDLFPQVWYNALMSKQRMIVTDDQLLIDMELLFNAIREAEGDWETVEAEMKAYLEAVQSMVSEE
ncbi:MAG: hypothetical protein GF381_02560 [Candidatus Pacebacteria bacterium]|nr:hypothetical protein [Candidatus Paceibacterota bacterium]